MTIESGTAEEVRLVGEDLSKIWSHDLVQKIVTHQITKDHDRQLVHASADVFLPDVKRVFAADFVLTDREALQVRCPTTAVETTTFCYKKENWSVKDVGGQIYERCAWPASFRGVSMILYIVSLADFDKFAGKRNVMIESRTLFKVDHTKSATPTAMCPMMPHLNSMSLLSPFVCEKEVCQCDALVGMPFVLLFNKVDVFEQKLKSTPFKVVVTPPPPSPLFINTYVCTCMYTSCV